MYVWGSNTYSELGLSEDQVNENESCYNKTEDSAFLDKPIKQTSFPNIVSDISCGNRSTSVLC